MSKESTLPISFPKYFLPKTIVSFAERNADNNYPKHTFHDVPAELKPIWDVAMAEIADGHALGGAYGPSGPPHGHVPANGSLFRGGLQ